MINRSLNYGRHHIKRFLSACMPYSTVLDLGAGHGDDLTLARKVNPQASLYAIENFPEYISELGQKGITVHSSDIERDNIPFADRSVDVVILNQILEHTKEIFWIFHEITRVLPIGGNVILGVPNLAALHNRILLSLGRQPSPLKNASAHVRGFVKRDILRFLEECFPGGYALRDFGGSNFYPFPPLLAKPLAMAFPTLAWGIFFMFEKIKDYRREFLDFPVSQKLETNFYLGDNENRRRP